MNKPLVSVVIPTFNSEMFLERCLSSVKSQTYSNIETIVVDNYSTDRTREIAENGVKVVLCRADRSKARNMGVGLAQGEFILSIDSDMELTPRVVEDCLNALKVDKKVGGVIIPERSVGNSFWVKVRDFERSFYVGTELESARFFKKALVEKVGGYEESVTFFEESTLAQKIEKMGYIVKVRIKSCILHYEGRFQICDWLMKKFYYGKTASDYKKTYANYANKQMNVLYRFFLFIKNKRFYSEPLLLVGIFVLKFLEFFSAGFGYLVGLLNK